MEKGVDHVFSWGIPVPAFAKAFVHKTVPEKWAFDLVTSTRVSHRLQRIVSSVFAKLESPITEEEYVTFYKTPM